MEGSYPEHDTVDVVNPDDNSIDSREDIEAILEAVSNEVELIDEFLYTEKNMNTTWFPSALVAQLIAPWMHWEWANVSAALSMIDAQKYGDTLTESEERRVHLAYRKAEDGNYGDLITECESVEAINATVNDAAERLDRNASDYIVHDDDPGEKFTERRGMTLSMRVRKDILEQWKPNKYARSEEVDGPTLDKGDAVQMMVGVLEDHWDYVMPAGDVKDWRPRLHVFNEARGIYEPRGEEQVRGLMEHLMQSESTTAMVDEVVKKLKRRNLVRVRQLEQREPGPFRIAVGNGVLDLRTGELDDYTADEYHRASIDVNYHPTAECGEIDEFMHDVMEDDDVPTMYRAIAHTLLKEYVSAKALLLVGEGKNGKSRLLELVEMFIGEHNVSGRSLQDLTSDQYAASDLQGALANINGDMSEQQVRNTSTFKKLTGGDRITGDIKWEKPVKFENHATLIFASNGVPEMPDNDMALWRRWIYINFPYKFGPDGDKEAVPRRKLMRRIASDDQFEGLLARCVEEIGEWWESGRDFFPNVDTPTEVRERMLKASDPVYAFASDCLDSVNPEDVDELSDAMERTERVRKAYSLYASEENLPNISAERFGSKIKSLSDYAVERRRTTALSDGPNREPAYTGIRLNQRGHELVEYDEMNEGDVRNASLKDEYEIPERIGTAHRDQVKQYIEENPEATVEDVREDLFISKAAIDELEVVVDRWGDG